MWRQVKRRQQGQDVAGTPASSGTRRRLDIEGWQVRGAVSRSEASDGHSDACDAENPLAASFSVWFSVGMQD